MHDFDNPGDYVLKDCWTRKLFAWGSPALLRYKVMTNQVEIICQCYACHLACVIDPVVYQQLVWICHYVWVAEQ